MIALPFALKRAAGMALPGKGTHDAAPRLGQLLGSYITVPALYQGLAPSSSPKLPCLISMVGTAWVWVSVARYRIQSCPTKKNSFCRNLSFIFGIQIGPPTVNPKLL